MSRRLLTGWALVLLGMLACSVSAPTSSGNAQLSVNTAAADASAAGSGGQAPSADGELFAPGDRSPHPSAGCTSGNASPAVGEQTLSSGGAAGKYLITVPQPYDPTSPYSLAFVFHGAMNSEITCRGGGNCPGVAMALEGNSIVIYPKSFGDDWTGDTREQNVTYFDDLLSFVKQNYCVDERRVYVVGTSSGAHFSNILGCRRGDELLAIAPAAGERLEKTGCKGRVAALVMHGVDDSHVPFSVGEEARDYYASANGCSTDTVPTLADMHAEVRAARDAGMGIFRCVDYQGCDDNLPVRWCEHSEGGYDGTTHGFPVEGGPTAWDFVSPL
jgi:poly(3-hydroxybutyrate) depolymerase